MEQTNTAWYDTERSKNAQAYPGVGDGYRRFPAVDEIVIVVQGAVRTLV